MLGSRRGFLWLFPCLMAMVVVGASGVPRTAMADSFDWRTVNGFNWNTPIKSQFGGTCWDFSSCATLEAKYKLTRNDPVFDADVSEQQICWETNPDMGSTGGGWGTAVLDYFTSHGAVSEAECPYQSSSPDVGIAPYWPLASGWQNRVWKSTSNLNDFTSDTNTMKSYLKTTGPLEVGLWAGHDLYTSVADMIANYRAPDASGFDHEVSLVGYQDDARIPTGGYWIIKNSWGFSNNNLNDYGNNGYYLIPYGNLEIHNDISAITGAVYYSGAMAAATWTGGAGTWAAGDATKWNSGTYAWENKETTATFTGAGGVVTISGTAITHGLTISSGATGYSFSGGALTVTSGGITANESTTISSPVTVGAPQSWTVASGRTLTVGDVHTIISTLTVTGSGNTTVNGTLDGGGVINSLGAAPGNIVKTGSGALSLNGPANYSGNISATAGTLNFIPTAGVTGVYSGAISGSVPISKSGAGTVVFSAANTYTGGTTVSNGALQANSGAGLPSSSYLSLDGGVLQSNVAGTFSRTLNGTSGSNRFRWTANGGGFAAGGGPLTVRVNNGTGALTWGTTVGSYIVGTLKFGSTTAANVVTFQNGINLNAATRTINVDDNPATGADYAAISGVISYGSGTAGITKTGGGVLVLTGADTYNGTTTVSGGGLQAAIGTGIPSSSFLKLDGGVYQSNGTYTFTRGLGSSGGAFQWTANGGGFAAGPGALTVNIGSGSALTWGTTVGSNIVGTLKFGSPTAANVTTFQNRINLNGANRTIQVDDNPSTNADYAVMSGVISNGTGTAGIVKTGGGILSLTATETYNGSTTISGGVLKADPGVGLPTNSFLALDGGVMQFNTATTFTRSMGTSGSTVEWTAYGGGFSTSANPLTVNIGNGTALSWGTTLGTNVEGTLKLNSLAAGNVLTFQNALNLNGGARTVQIDSPNQASNVLGSDYVVMSGVLSDSAGGATLTKTGAGVLALTGSAGNTYSGLTTVTGGGLYLNKTSGYAIPGNLTLAGNTQYWVTCQRDNQIAPTSTINWSGTGAWQELQLMGHSLTLAGISATPTAGGVIQGAWDDTGISANSVLTVNNTVDCSYTGYMRDKALGSGTGHFQLVKSGPATLTLGGGNISYTGGTTINAGKLVLQDVTDGSFLASSIVNNATLELNNSTDATFNTPVSGSGVLSKADGNTLTLGSNVNCSGGLSFNSGTVVMTDLNTAILGGAITNGGALTVNTNATNMTISGPISNGTNVGQVIKNGPGILTLTGNNTYGDGVGWIGFTTVNGGVLQADRGAGLPAGSCLVLNGGVFQSNSVATFDTGFWYNWGFLTWNGGGFSAGGGKLTVNVGGGQQLTWGTDGWSNLAGTMILSSTSARYETQVLNNIDLNGGARTIQVDKNPNSTGDFATISGVISDSVGGATLTKTGLGKLVLTGANTYTGGTNVNAGLLAAAGTAVPGSIAVNSGGAFSPGVTVGSATTGGATWNGGGKYVFEIDSATGAAGSNWDLWSIVGSLSASSAFTISAMTESSDGVAGQMPNFNNANSYQWLLASTTGAMPSNLVSMLSLDGGGFQNALAGTGRIYLSESADFKSLYLNYSPTGGTGNAPMVGGGAAVPEPGTLALLAAGLAGLLAYGWRKRR
jgi:fibronectin-binding autotransporter adhesin